MRPFRGGAVTHNGAALYREAALKPGDVIGVGGHFLFLYRDPRVSPAPPLALALPWQADAASTPCCPSGLVDRQEALRQYLASTEALLKFHPRHADALLQVRPGNDCRAGIPGARLSTLRCPNWFHHIWSRFPLFHNQVFHYIVRAGVQIAIQLQYWLFSKLFSSRTTIILRVTDP